MNDDLAERYAKMHSMYQEGKTLDDIGIAFGVGKAAVSRAFKAMGFQTRPLSHPRYKDPVLPQLDEEHLIQRKRQWDTLTTQAKGTVAEYAVANRLVELGFVVWMPFVANTAADLAVSVDGRVLKIQVKCATYDPKYRRFRVMLVTRDRDGKRIGYADDAIDFFLIYCPGVDEKYVVPGTVAKKHSSANLVPQRGLLRPNRGPDWESYKDAFSLIRGAR